MTVSPELMKALLAMHAYNRGYNEGVKGLGNDIGTATYVRQSDVLDGSEAVNSSFYAAAYNYFGETVISFRGTDDKLVDPLTGWHITSFGWVTEQQPLLAAEFYKQVTDGELFGPSNISFAGHPAN